jgi:hypothetical protein
VDTSISPEETEEDVAAVEILVLPPLREEIDPDSAAPTLAADVIDTVPESRPDPDSRITDPPWL